MIESSSSWTIAYSNSASSSFSEKCKRLAAKKPLQIHKVEQGDLAKNIISDSAKNIISDSSRQPRGINLGQKFTMQLHTFNRKARIVWLQRDLIEKTLWGKENVGWEFWEIVCQERVCERDEKNQNFTCRQNESFEISLSVLAGKGILYQNQTTWFCVLTFLVYLTFSQVSW